MISIEGTIIFLAFWGVIFGFVLLRRTDKVYHFLRQLLEQTSEAAKIDIRAGRNWEWRYEMLNSVSYDSMLYRFWIPLKPECFYKDLSFLKREDA